MFSLIKSGISLAFTAAVILILGSIVQIEGMTISDHVKEKLGTLRPKAIYNDVKGWTSKTADKYLPEGLKKRVKQDVKDQIKQSRASAKNGKAKRTPPQHRIEKSEREKLRQLIDELNN